jgi:murein L,D-transpeptidase YcbB/YkuD
VRSHRVIVGKSTTTTPTFSTLVEAVILNPSWVPPVSILRNEIVPKLRHDTDYATRQGFEIVDEAGRSIDPGAIEWSALDSYHIRQRPGPKNALGKVKLDMPNAYGIYLHDTPELGLFERLKRTFSHGCIRVQSALALADALLGGDGLDSEFIEFALSIREETKIRLLEPVPTFILYLTAGTDEAGKIVYVDDVYRRDAPLIAALEAADAAAQGVELSPTSAALTSHRARASAGSSVRGSGAASRQSTKYLPETGAASGDDAR